MRQRDKMLTTSQGNNLKGWTALTFSFLEHLFHIRCFSLQSLNMLALFIFEFRKLLSERVVAFMLGGNFLAGFCHHRGLFDQGLKWWGPLLVKRSWQWLAGPQGSKTHSPQGLIECIKIIGLLWLGIMLPPTLWTVPIPFRISWTQYFAWPVHSFC